MATPNGLNPTFEGRASAKGFDAIHGKGISTTTVACTGTTAVAFFGNPNGFNGTITGVFVTALTTTGQTITLTNATGTIVVTSPSSVGSVVGATASGTTMGTAVSATGTLTIVSGAATDTSLVTITYKVSES